MEKFSKRRISLHYWLLGKGYLKALKAMDFAAEYHKGTRKDGVTPEFDHQISIAHYVRTLLPSLEFAEETLCVIFLHDVCEDYHVSREEIERQFGTRVADAVWRMTKTWRGQKMDEARLFEAMAECPIASIAKGADRIHNLQSMVGVFTPEKQKTYMGEVRDLFLPMLKKARKLFPQQEAAYENIKHMLTSQLELIGAIHAA
jgi:(p)ppGpp synthase/HD superfamily hydrolase